MHSYLGRYDEADSRELALQVKPYLGEQTFDFTLVVPAYRESSAFFSRLQAEQLRQNRVLLILVLNQPEDDTDEQANRALQHHILTNGMVLARSNFFNITQTGSSLVITLDYFSGSRKLPLKQGVGAARKIGSDLACHLIQQGRIKHPWIFNTDADTRLAEDYFTAAEKYFVQNTSALLFSFRHIPSGDKATDTATLLYEKSLNYYVQALKWAGSAYAFHTIGSCIVVSAKHYKQARGYPKRAAGEDFYLLNKLAKLGNIKTLQSVIEIESRQSNRAPFGTGPAVEKIIREKEYPYYNPKIFVELKNLIQHSKDLFSYKNKQEQWLAKLPKTTQEALTDSKVHTFFNHLNRQIKTEKECQQHWREWFDGFKTLKWIHSMEASYPRMDLDQALVRFNHQTQR